jgi:uncharacterized membrane protein
LAADNLNENVDTVASLRARAEEGMSPHQRRIERFTSLLARPRSFYLVMAFATIWSASNLFAARLGARPWDPPPFFWLQGLIGLGALLMTITILTTQNRQTRHADERAQLDLKINLLTEQKVAKLIALLEELRRDLPSVRNRVDEVAEVMQEHVDPHVVMAALEQTLDTNAVPPGTAEPSSSPEPQKDE